eukprot:TRINITY_DN637_c0_g1_i1.p1 TRINITY_DN637_c0_g1~~TRINITY_DN637_c0_g1_i1.p1  ORF type:complete len:266 (-),score=51.52 TRINITY_DN637_c0_g1_i1:233-1030(-)
MSDANTLLHRAHSGNKDFSWMNDGAGEESLSEEMKRSYDAVAERADDSQYLHMIDRFPVSQEAWDTMCRATADLCNIKPGDTVFDAGCGCGAWLDSIDRQFPENQIKMVGLDFSAGLIDIANRRLPNGDWRLGDARSYPDIPDNSFEVSVSFGVFFYFDSQEECIGALEELVRVTKPGGRVLVGRMNSKEKFDEMGEETVRRNYAKYVPRQCKVDSGVFWMEQAERLGITLLAVKQMGELYDIHACGDSAMGRLRHCAYFEIPLE